MQTLNVYRPSTARSEGSGVVQHVFLIATPGAPRPGIVHRGNPLHAMQMILVSAEDARVTPGAIGPIPPAPSPQVLQRPAAAAPALMPREITGTILRDARGRLYEKIGDYVRPVNQLCRDAQGQVIDLLPVRKQEAAKPIEPAEIETSSESEIENESQDEQALIQDRPFRELARQLAPEPGFWRVVRYADFIDAITPQLAASQRLQPSHQLACYVQVYELTTKIMLAALEQAAARELGVTGKLVPLSYELCRRFGLSLPRPAFALAATQAYNSPGTVFPGARFITLRVALDPTVETAPAPPTSAEGLSSQPVAQTAQPSGTAAPASSAGSTAKASIPDEFCKPWTYHHAREEILYDMRLAASHGAIRRLVDSLFDGVSKREMKKWLSILNGRSTDEQLWAIKPPRGGLHDARVRTWLTQTLQLGGYDVSRMQVEWEIHWRRQAH